MMHPAVAWVFPEDIDIDSVPSEFRTGDTDSWSAVFNPIIERMLDFHLVHKLIHNGYVNESVLACTSHFLYVLDLCLVSGSHWMASTLLQHSARLVSMRSTRVS